MKPALLSTSLFVGACLFAAQAKADTITEPLAQTGFLTTDITNAPLAVQLFDSNLGTLQSVSFAISADAIINGSLTNNAVATEPILFNLTSTFTFSDHGGPLDQAGVFTGFTVTPQVSATVPNGATEPLGPFNTTANATITGPLSAFEQPGGGADTIFISSLTNQALQFSGGNYDLALTTVENTQIQVTYTYAAVPEPGSAMLFIAGALVFYVKRGKRSMLHLS